MVTELKKAVELVTLLYVPPWYFLFYSAISGKSIQDHFDFYSLQFQAKSLLNLMYFQGTLLGMLGIYGLLD